MSSQTAEVSAEDVGVTEWRQLIPPSRWARACLDTSDEYFKARVRVMDSEEHLQLALEFEVSIEETRSDRVALLNKRLQEVRE